MASKMRKLVKKKERLVDIQNKYKDIRKLGWKILALTTILTVFFAILFFFRDGDLKRLSAFSGFIIPAVGAIIYIVACTEKIRDLNEDIAEVDEDIQNWEQHLRET